MIDLQKQQLLIKSGYKTLKSIYLPDDGVVMITMCKGKVKDFSIKQSNLVKEQEINFDQMMKHNKPVEGPL